MVKKAAAVLVMLVFHLATACTPAAPTPTLTPERPTTTLTVYLGGEPSTLDPGLATDTVSRQVVDNLFLGLTGIRYDTAEVIPRLATEWEVSEDGLVWTFHLRDDVYWVHYDPQTGVAEKKRKVTAHDVEYAIRRTIDPATGSDYVYVDYIIHNAEAINAASESFSVGVGVTALDDYTVQFTLKQPAAYFPSIAGHWVNYPLPKEVVKEFEHRWTEPGNLWTCGPYLLDIWRRRNRIVLVKNPHYYDAHNVAIDAVTVAMVSEASTALHMYQNGDLDSTLLPIAEPHEELERARADPQLSKELHWEPDLDLTTAFMRFNVSKPPVDNPLVRKALAAATDKQKMVGGVLGAEHIPAETFAPPEVVGSPAENPNFEGIPFDPEQAREWLAEAGYPDGQGFPELILSYTTHEANKPVADFIQQQWREHLGIEVKLVAQEWQVLMNALGEDPPPVWGLAWIADYPDENNFVLEVCHPTKTHGRYSRWNAEDPAAQRFMEVTEAAAAESDPQVRKALYFEAEKILCVDEAIMVPLWHYRLPYLTKAYVDRAYNSLGQGFAKWRVEAH